MVKVVVLLSAKVLIGFGRRTTSSSARVNLPKEMDGRDSVAFAHFWFFFSSSRSYFYEKTKKRYVMKRETLGESFDRSSFIS